MGKFQRIWCLLVLVLMVAWAVGMFARPLRLASDQDDEEDSSGRWEGVAMARADRM